jgi:TPR repeat protein
LQLAEGKSEVLGEFYAKTPMVPAFPSPDAASEWLRPALIGAVAPSISRAPRCGLGFSIGGSLYLVSVALLASATVGVFFGIAFFLLRQSADAMVSVWPVGGHVSDVGAPPQGGLPRGGAAAPRGSTASTAIATTARTLRPNVAPATPGPAQKALAGEPTKTAAQVPAALRLPDRQLVELLDRGDVFLRAGDIASARLFYERAADAGDGQAALRMGATFDPTFLASAGLRNLRGDLAKARLWYHRALGLGANEAQPHLNNLETK